jgi:aspartyl-tRNA(Asn)/glutamyl-tRNA(Gln) amidotransferase subunit A
MLLDLSIQELADGLKEKKFSSVDLINECFTTIERLNPTINACITVCDRQETIKIAEAKDKERNGNSGVLHGIPFILKDSYVTQGVRTTAASNILKSFIPSYSATVYQKLLDAGAILVGKANMDAWGHGATSENTDFGSVKNPWNQARSAGGSTGGVAAAISTRMAAFGIGEDTGGSIRNPSAWCNITGLKVTYGRVSRYGCIAYASSFDTVGPMAKTAADCAAVLEVIAGIDPYDATSSPHEVVAYSQKLETKKKLTIGMPKEFFTDGLNHDIAEHIKAAAAVFEKQGHTIKQISMPSISFGIPVYYLIAPSETSSNLARYDGVRFGLGRQYFTPETDRRILIGTYALSAGYYDAYYKKAQQVRTVFIEAYKKAFTECDVLLMPVTPMQPTKLGDIVSDPKQNMLLDIFTVTHNPVGVPSLALPCGFSSDTLPIGMQITAPMFKEETLFALAHEFQNATDFHTKKPKLIE